MRFKCAERRYRRHSVVFQLNDDSSVSVELSGCEAIKISLVE